MEGKSLVPKLRFPEFRQAREWHVRSLGDLFAERQESGFTDLPLLSVTDKEGVIPQEQTNRRDSSNIDRSKYLRVVPGDIAYNTMRMWEGRSALVGLEGVVSPAYTVCKPKAESNSRFFSFYFKTPQLIENFRKFSQGLVKDTLNLKYEAFSKIFALVPSPAEQKKVAECLSSLDELIAAERRKLEALRAHKKGLMQNLFPREGETNPRLRFPEFRDAPGWEQRLLGSETLFFKGRGVSKADVDPNGSRPCIRYGELYTRYGEVIDTVHSRTSAPEAELFLSSKNDVIIPASGETKEDIATASCVTLDGVALGGDINVLRTNHNGIFLSYLINGVHRRAIAKVAQGDTIVHLYPSQLAQVRVVLPEAPEQQKIAECLTSLDERITAQEKKLDTLKLHRQGLMQGLFPSSEEAQA